MRALILFGLLVAAPVSAQDTLSGQIQFSETATDAQMLEFARGALLEMADADKTVSKMVENAEREGDQNKTQCLKNKLAAIRALDEVSKRAEASMKAMMAAKQAEKTKTEFRKIAVASAKVRQFVQEAEACIGQSGASRGDTVVDVGGPLTDDDGLPTTGEDVDPIIPDPPKTSPFE